MEKTQIIYVIRGAASTIECMTELIEVFGINGEFISTQNRADFYSSAEKEFKDTGEVTRRVKTIRLLLMNSDGRIYLQKRSKQKAQNANMYDKTIGGHVTSGHTPAITLVQECAEELGFPAALLKEDEFLTAIQSTDLSIIGLFRKIGYEQNFQSKRQKTSGSFVVPHETTFYIGYYDGAIRFADGEASGVEVFSLSELHEDLQSSPDKYTEDLRYMINEYEKYLIPIEQLPKPVKEV